MTGWVVDLFLFGKMLHCMDMMAGTEATIPADGDRMSGKAEFWEA